LEARPGDGHSHLGWDQTTDALLSHPLAGVGDRLFQVGLALGALRLFLLDDGKEVAGLDLDGLDDHGVGEWLDERLRESGLAPASPVDLPYTLPEGAAVSGAYRSADTAEARAELVRWYELAQASLSAAVAALGEQASPVRCWPHHFDIASLVSLEAGDAEEARSIGMGMSPGDGNYAEPYFYVNPWPHLKPEGLPELPEPGRWHVDGWVGAVATASGILALGDRGAQLLAFLHGAREAGQEALGL
jgi:hypothetical protein